ncbi:alpha/beta fold hydrolase [Peristeroidobacter soli]|uniref:alpha/beta fold hydrolase n=1 Tax=Peristeroidobacter soli TaxID=2497877 RepID=UPI00101CCFDA|nr:alpha/beta hydrolase [Peristeroidobacter soli]
MMKCVWLKRLALSTALCAALYSVPGLSHDLILTPDQLRMDGEPALEAERGLIFVPENRADPASRKIAVHFLRFRALAAPAGASEAKRAPVFLVAGGPGSDFTFTSRWEREQLRFLRATRDVIYVSQRGNPRAPGLVPAMTLPPAPLPLDLPGSAEQTRQSQRSTLEAALQEWTRRGVDLRGYDILNIVDDLHDVRAALGYDKIVLRGCSFGSQWSLSYLKRWPQTVDRALLSGVEPLDHTYDDPRGLWTSMVHLAQLAEADPSFAKYVPKGGLIKSLQNVLQRLEAQPAKVEIEEPKTGRRVQVTVGADDLRELVRNANGFGTGTRLDSLANWPRFLAELDAGDYRYLAAKTWESRTSTERSPLILLLIDNSLDITAARDAYLRKASEEKWLGDINDHYHNTRDLTPTRRVGDDFRADWSIDVPVMLLNGDLDWSTPIENSRHLRGFLKQGHLLEIAGGTHCTEMNEVMAQQPELMQKVYSFIDADFTTTPAQQFFASMPKQASLAPMKFQAVTGPSLYEQWRGRAR